jgi:tRNA-splicing ligase RtcB
LPDNKFIIRKGAVDASAGELGIIPSNMAGPIFMVRGLGNETYLRSASHGAGRKMGRNQAFQKLSMEQFEEHTRGVICKVKKSNIDEAPMAYKDIYEVISRQEGVVLEVIDTITPRINLTGVDESNANKYLKKMEKKRKRLEQQALEADSDY